MISRKTVEHLRAAIFIRNLEAESEREAISKMLDALKEHPQVRDLQEFSAAVFDRQEADPPLFPGGIAFPHARTNAVSELVMVNATCSRPILFSGVPVRLIFLIGIPKRAGADYLELISFLARHVRGARIVDQLVKAENMASFLAGFVEGT